MSLEQELIQYLKEHKLNEGIKPHLIQERDDYFKQAVIIMSNVPETEDNAKLITDIDVIFLNYGYKPYEFVNAITEYKKELEELYKKIRSVE